LISLHLTQCGVLLEQMIELVTFSLRLLRVDVLGVFEEFRSLLFACGLTIDLHGAQVLHRQVEISENGGLILLHQLFFCALDVLQLIHVAIFDVVTDSELVFWP